MAFPEDVFPAADICEICGATLGDEIVIQEFADGTYARLCPECAAGAAFAGDADVARGPLVDEPHSQTASAGAAAGEIDRLEMTRELLVPVTDLITLQGEMQAALERLAGSLERFAAEVITDSRDKTATVENRLKSLEAELEKTRNHLRDAEALLLATTDSVAPGKTGDLGPAPASEAADSFAEGPPPVYIPTIPPVAPEGEAGESGAGESGAGEAAGQPTGAGQTTGGYGPDTTGEPQPALAHTWPGTPPPPPAGIENTIAGQTGATAPGHQAEVFTLEEVQWSQRYFNEGPFISRLRDVRRSLGRPQVNLSRLAGPEPRVFVTVFWDIVWYQYLVDLRRDIPTGDRVSLFREGMELEELNEWFKVKNAMLDDDGRLDASELEVQLLSDPTVLISEMTPDQERALEDATEEIWDQHAAPEFKWDD